MESSPFWFSGKQRPDFVSYASNQFGPCTVLVNPVSMVSEFGTTLITHSCYSNDCVKKSLKSLASENSFKHYRKKMLLSIVRGENKPLRPATIKKYNFGMSFGEDAVALYLSWKVGREWVLENYCDGIPKDIDFNMAFYEKINKENMKTIDPKMRYVIERKLFDLGMEYTKSNDLSHLEKVNRFLKSRTNYGDR